MENIFRRTAGWKWIPDADPVNAPDGSLLLATNTIPDRLGARSLRLGSLTLYSGLQEQRVHSIYTPILQSVVHRLFGIDDQVYRDGMSFGEAFDGEGDISFVDDSYQAFMARGTTKKKFDGTNFHNWGIAAPEFPATLAAVNALVSQVATFDSTGEADVPGVGLGSAFVANEGTNGFVDNYAGTPNSAMNMIPDAATGRASVSKKFLADVDFQDIAGSIGGASDLFDIRAWLQDPRKVDKVTIMFGLGTGDDPFLDDYYYFEFNIRNDGTADVKDENASGAAAYQIYNTKLLAALTPDEITQLQSPEEAAAILKRLGGRNVGPETRERADAQQNSPAWGHFTVVRGQFIRVGHTPDRDWKTIRGFKVVYTVVPGSTDALYLDDAIFTGGGDRALTGTFQVGYRFARRFLDSNGATVYTELSPMSPISDKVVLRQQTMQITIPAASLSGADPQVDTVWVYLYGGWLNTFYRFVITSSEPNSGMTIDELTNPSGSDFEDPEERVRLTSHGFTLAPGAGSGTDDLIFIIRKSELEALSENEPFEPGAVSPPNNIIGLAGPWLKRVFALTEEGWLYPSTVKSPSCFSLYHVIDLRMYGEPYWIVKTAAGIYAGFSKDIIRVAGSGGEDEAHIVADLYAQPLNIANPPVDSMVAVEGNTVIYRSADGIMICNGATATPLPYSGTSLLWKGESRGGVNALNRETGRFRLAIDNHDIYMLAPEGHEPGEEELTLENVLNSDPFSVWKYQSSPEGQWCRFTYPDRFISIHREPDGSLLCGTATGAVVEIETGTNDDGTPISAEILTPISEGSNPLAQKDPSDFQLHGTTGGADATIDFYANGDVTPTLMKTVNLTQQRVYRNRLTDLGAFLRIQLRITGSFTTFVLNALNMQVVSRPQHVMVLDAGAVIPAAGTDVAWITQVEIDAQSSSDLELLVYKNDTLHATLPVPVNVGKRDVYTVVMPRETKARRISFILRTTAADGQGEIGFECYSMKARHAITGNVTELNVAQGDSGNA